MIEQQRPEWGLVSELPERFGVAWGARAILNGNGTFDLLGDRQSMAGPDDSRKAFAKALNGRYLPILRNYVREQKKRGCLSGWSEELHEVYDDGSVVVKCNTNGSCGYLYIIAYTPDETEGKWSGFNGRTIPDVGETINAEISDFGDGIVIGRREVHGWIGVCVVFDDPPKWYCEQNVDYWRDGEKLMLREGTGAACPALLYGAEISPSQPPLQEAPCDEL